MQTIYQTTITHIGDFAREALSDQMLITFREGAPQDIQDYCFIHQHGQTQGELHSGAYMDLAGVRYPVTAVGDVATQNLRELGHITLRFDGRDQAEFPGSVHVKGMTPEDIPLGSILKFID
ncbi:PTS glucitol/sorbitol transporter subunit IIA [Ewingella americana]|jgi:PTS system glucitol/sorbitol-specific IIA component